MMVVILILHVQKLSEMLSKLAKTSHLETLGSASRLKIFSYFLAPRTWWKDWDRVNLEDGTSLYA